MSCAYLTAASLLLAPPPSAPAKRSYDGPRRVDAPDAEVPVPAIASRSSTEPSQPPQPPEPAAPKPPEPPEPPEPDKTWEVGLLADLAYLVNNNFPDNHVYRPMAPSPRTGEFAINVVAGFLDHRATDDEPWQLQLAVHAGSGVDALYEAEPNPGGDDGRFAGAEVFKHIGLANVGVKAPWGMQVNGGLMPAPLGVEWFWSHRNWMYSASWTALGTPYYLMGLSVDQELPADVHVFGWVVNGWQTIADVNRAPSYLVGANWAPTDGLLAASMVYFGPENPDISPRAWRVHSDSFVQYAGDRWGVAAMWDYGQEKRTREPGEPIFLWTGGGLFVHGSPLVRDRVVVDIAARPDFWWDRDGVIFGTRGWLLSGAVQASADLFDVVLVRIEYRYDRATDEAGFFYRDDAITNDAPGLAHDQHTVFFNVSGHFEHQFAVRRRRRSAD